MNIIYIVDVLIKSVTKEVLQEIDTFEYSPVKRRRKYWMDGYLKSININNGFTYDYYEIEALGTVGQLPYISSVKFDNFPVILDEYPSIFDLIGIAPTEFYLINKDRFGIFLGRQNDSTTVINKLNHFRL